MVSSLRTPLRGSGLLLMGQQAGVNVVSRWFVFKRYIGMIVDMLRKGQKRLRLVGIGVYY